MLLDMDELIDVTLEHAYPHMADRRSGTTSSPLTSTRRLENLVAKQGSTDGYAQRQRREL